MTEELEQSIADRIASKFGALGTSTEGEESPETQAPEPDLAEIEWAGEKFQIPGKLKDAFLQNQDYTQKSQRLAEDRRSIDHVRELAKSAHLDQTFSQSVAAEQEEIAVIDAYLKQAGKVDWTSMSAEQMMRHKIELDAVKDRKAALKQAIEEKRSKFNEEVNTRLSDLRNKARELASKQIEGFSEQTEKDVRAHAQSHLGLTEKETDSVLLDPRSYRAIWESMQYRAIKAGAKSVPDKAQRVLKPGGSSERMPPETVARLNLRKELKSAKTSGDKARAIEANLIARFERGKA